MKIAHIGEFGLIERISSFCKSSHKEGVVLHIGDDCAALKFNKPLVVVSTDLLIENVHFKRSWITPFQLGFKSLAVSISDIAAMGGTARFFLFSIALPSDYTVEDVSDLYAGAHTLAQKHSIEIIGGDTSASDSNVLFINGTILGEADEIVKRSGAHKGDKIYISGTPGDSSAGLFLLQKYGNQIDLIQGTAQVEKGKDFSNFIPLVNRHLMPEPRFVESCENITSMIDISDGLLQDLGHILDKSNVGATVYLDKIPLSQPLKSMAERFHKDPFQFALTGGEDYELLFTSPESTISGYHCIGEITKEGRTIIDSEGRALSFSEKGGYDHFRTR
jgi:thiamine-monophosphate kinase